MVCKLGGEVYQCASCPRSVHGDCTGHSQAALDAMMFVSCLVSCPTCFIIWLSSYQIGRSTVVSTIAPAVREQHRKQEVYYSGSFINFSFLFVMKYSSCIVPIDADRCQVCDVSLCEDCLGTEEIEAIGDVLPEFLVLQYGRRAQAYYMYVLILAQHCLGPIH